MSYLEPCCIDRQMPALLKEAKSGFAFFATNGDVLLSHYLQAVSYMAGEGHVLVISVPAVDIELLRTINHYLSRGWTRALCLLTGQPQDELIEAELAGHIGKVQYASDPLILDGMVAIIGKEKAVVIQGAILSKQDFSLCHYVAWTGKDKEVLQQAIEPLVAKLKTKARIDHHDNEDIAMLLNRSFLTTNH